MNLSRDQKDAAFRELVAHLKAADIAPPSPGAKTPEEVYDLALQGRAAWHVDGYDYVFIEPVMNEGRVVGAGFVRCDDDKAVRTGPIPEIGRLTDVRYWGKRSIGDVPVDANISERVGELVRQLESLTNLNSQIRKGAEFSKKNKALITSAAEQAESTATTLEDAARSSRTLSETLRTLITKTEADEPDDDGRGVSAPNAAVSDPAGSHAAPTGGNQGKRPLHK